ncbi:MAG TPA: hypothetical protein VF524_03785 [Polyangia bacterium]
MPTSLRVNIRQLASAGIATLAVAVCASSCRKLIGGNEQTSMGDIEANLDQLINVTKTGLNLQVSPRFTTFGPLPSAAPWDAPVPGARTFETQGQRVSFKTGSDGLIHERYEARACPLREIWSCVELWATGKFGKDGQLACVGLRLEKGDTIEKRTLDMRTADNCPFMTTTPGPAQQIVRGIEKAQLEHTQRQEVDKYLDPKAQ